MRTAPLATVLLVLMNVGMAAWVLPVSERLRWERRLAAREMADPTAALGLPSASTGRALVARQAALQARVAALDAQDPFQSWGYRRGAPPSRALGALFVHADAVHLGANLLVLGLVGAALEQVWGAAGILALFLAAGSAALVLDARSGPPTLVVGASGGVAALLGAYCVRFRRQPLRWGYVHLIYLRPHFGSFKTPCLLLAALWLLQQAAGAVLAIRSGDQSVAFVSHLAGFGIGAACAGVAAGLAHKPRPALGAGDRQALSHP